MQKLVEIWSWCKHNAQLVLSTIVMTLVGGLGLAGALFSLNRGKSQRQLKAELDLARDTAELKQEAAEASMESWQAQEARDLKLRADHAQRQAAIEAQTADRMAALSQHQVFDTPEFHQALTDQLRKLSKE